ncbi:uncharacterized protein LOC129587343 [Paramacrobiotus metropolitanus]|uniref:uncharacterized protein LOC129587343 n=1 Tax=Paramacrobiotus metropolitanus TaxID=2943436 RepID=UPI0024462D3D|nr:uncharacterized protein LOC129587343 [Paramacrobiotus metropolitanus]
MFNETPVNVRKCSLVLTKILYMLNQGETLSAREATNFFFAITKLFQSQDVPLRRLVFLCIKELCKVAEDVIIVTSSLMKDMTGKEEAYRAAAIRALCMIVDQSMLQSVERYMKQAVVDKSPHVASAALLASLHFCQRGGQSAEVVKRWANEVQEATNSDNPMVQYHALALLYNIRKGDRLAVNKLLAKFTAGRYLKSPLAVCFLVKVVAKTIQEEAGLGQINSSNFDFLESCLRHKSEMVVNEAAHALVNLRHASGRELTPALSVLHLFRASDRPVLRHTAHRALTHLPSACNENSPAGCSHAQPSSSRCCSPLRSLSSNQMPRSQPLASSSSSGVMRRTRLRRYRTEPYLLALRAELKKESGLSPRTPLKHDNPFEPLDLSQAMASKWADFLDQEQRARSNEDAGFAWSIDHMAALQPVDIPHQDVLRTELLKHVVSESDEEDAQDHIRRFFNDDAVHPMTPTPDSKRRPAPSSDEEDSDSEAEALMLGVVRMPSYTLERPPPSALPHRDAAVQTDVSIPARMDFSRHFAGYQLARGALRPLGHLHPSRSFSTATIRRRLFADDPGPPEREKETSAAPAPLRAPSFNFLVEPEQPGSLLANLDESMGFGMV